MTCIVNYGDLSASILTAKTRQETLMIGQTGQPKGGTTMAICKGKLLIVMNW